MSEIYRRGETAFGGSFDSNSAAIAFGDVDVALVQNVSFSHQYAAQRLYEIGSVNNKSRVYYMAGRTSGNVSLSRILGPPVAIKAFYDKYGDVCNVESAADNNALALRFKQGCGGNNAARVASDIRYTLKFTLLIAVQLSVQTGEMTTFSESMNMMFTGIDYQGPAGNNAAAGVFGQAAGAALGAGAGGVPPFFPVATF